LGYRRERSRKILSQAHFQKLQGEVSLVRTWVWEPGVDLYSILGSFQKPLHFTSPAPALPCIFPLHRVAKPVLGGQIEMPESMEINHRIIQTTAYHLS
jgi:hypothetical protein